jgi:hypothetical protein
MTHERMVVIARKRAQYALAKIADMQMNTWTKYPEPITPADIIAAQMMEAMNDAITDERNV